MELITLTKTRFLYLSLALLIVVAVAWIVVSPASGDLWCRQFGMPAYEKQFGFRLGSLEVHEPQGSTYSAIGIAWVDSEGAFARAGIRAGDVPRLHHGLGELCGELSAASAGGEGHLRVFNVADGATARRSIVIRPGQ